MTAPAPDLERFRLRPFVERLVEAGEAEVHADPIDLIDVAAVLDGNPRAVLFANAGPEGAELVGGVTGSRARIAAGFDCPPENLLALVLERLAVPQELVEVGRDEAPVQEVVLTGEDADLTRSSRSISSTRSTAGPTSRRRSTTSGIPGPGSPISAAGG